MKRYAIGRLGMNKQINLNDIKLFEPLEYIEIDPIIEDYKLSQSMEFTCEVMDVNFNALKEAFEAPAEAPVFIKYKYGLPTQKRLHKKKRIAKKWAKQGKYKKIRKTVFAEVMGIDAAVDEDITHYTMELKR